MRSFGCPTSRTSWTCRGRRGLARPWQPPSTRRGRCAPRPRPREAERRARRIEQRCSDLTRFDTVAPLRRRLGGSQLAPAAPGARSVSSARGPLAVEIEALDATSHRRRAAPALAHRDASCSPSPTSPRSTTASSTPAASPGGAPSAPTSCPLPAAGASSARAPPSDGLESLHYPFNLNSFFDRRTS